MSNQIQSESRSSVLEVEVNELQVELQQLQSKREELSRRPVFSENTSAAEVAQRVVSTVSQNAGSLRAVDSTIEVLMERLGSKRSQLSKAQEAERKSAAQQEVDAAVVEMKICCDRINEMSRLVEDELQKLQSLAAQCGPARWVLHPFQTYTPFLAFDPNLTMPHAIAGETSFGVQPRPVNMPL